MPWTVQGLEGISKQITLVEIEVAWENEFQEVIVRKAADIFGAPRRKAVFMIRSPSGCWCRLFFSFIRPTAERQIVQLRPPGTLTNWREIRMPIWWNAGSSLVASPLAQ